jgi:hypothetical protein
MRIFSTTLIATAGMIVALAAPAGAATSLADDFGSMNAQWVFTAPRASWDAQLSAMAAGGVRGVRSDATWAAVEPNPPANGVHTYNWSSTDAVAGALAQRGLRWQPVLDYSAKWASRITGDEHALPTNPADYAAYAGAFAARYGPNGAFWRANPQLPAMPVRSYEIWNEENLSYFSHTGVDPSGYADLYAGARQAIHAQAASAQVVVGGLSPGGQDPPKFIEAMEARRPDLRGNLDAVALHPYATTEAAAVALVVRLRWGLWYLGSVNAPILANELGWSTAGSTPTTDAARAPMLAQLASDLARSDCGVTNVAPYTWTGNQAAGGAEAGYGLVDAAGNQSLAASAYLSTIRDVAAGKLGAPGSLKSCFG